MDVWKLDPQYGIALAEGLCDMGERIILAENLHDWGDETCPFLKLGPGIFLITEEKCGQP
jgi:hypothetical protein